MRAVLVFLALVGVAGCSRTIDGSGSVAAPRFLSHRAVELYMQQQGLGQRVVCNRGHDFAMTSNGAQFGCVNERGRRFVVTITDDRAGRYVVG